MHCFFIAVTILFSLAGFSGANPFQQDDVGGRRSFSRGDKIQVRGWSRSDFKQLSARHQITLRKDYSPRGASSYPVLIARSDSEERQPQLSIVGDSVLNEKKSTLHRRRRKNSKKRQKKLNQSQSASQSQTVEHDSQSLHEADSLSSDLSTASDRSQSFNVDSSRGGGGKEGRFREPSQGQKSAPRKLNKLKASVTNKLGAMTNKVQSFFKKININFVGPDNGQTQAQDTDE
ncbi:hypothetical protein AMATHDRAFT_50303 [Amanita thiersii Skay4041]|uniref:Uncharacterized protein n=1 Tax=Amanita thiersii Skay4041 TaxID=703135 RepID=A0A2A9N962_9AGAR|nr:hypothetical protein AMATHDRAFT_50303 [Amanita thiersii Skay4041]